MTPSSSSRARILFRTLVEDSVFKANFIVLAVASTLSAAQEILHSNGRQKIVPVASEPSEWKWPKQRLLDLYQAVTGSSP